jgi:uncharacterized protein
MPRAIFRTQEEFETRRNAYRLLPFRFMRWHKDEVLVTNECGEYEFLTADTFQAFATGLLNPADTVYQNLKAKHFLSDSESVVPLELLATKVRTKRSFLEGFTRLHLFVTTLRCDHTCPYCQVSRVTEDRTKFDMTIDTARRAVDWVFQSPAKELKIEFQGGEPTLNWDVLAYVVQASSKRAVTEGRSVEYVIATNLSSLTDEMLNYCREHKIHLSTSLDGPAVLHNQNRPRPGRDSHERVMANLGRARAALGNDRVSALMTTTPASLDCPIEIIDEYVALGFDSVFLRPVSPYGFATRTGLHRSYSPQRFLEFYKAGLAHVIELNRCGVHLVEAYSQLLLRKMLTPFPVGYVDLQSPAGTVLGALVYNYDGAVYASDEGRMLAEMNDYSFKVGELSRDSYREVMTSTKVRALVEQSCLETLPGCSECAYLPYCGADPVFNWATQGDIVGYRPTSAFCQRQMGMFRHLFELLRSDDVFVRRLLLTWARN